MILISQSTSSISQKFKSLIFQVHSLFWIHILNFRHLKHSFKKPNKLRSFFLLTYKLTLSIYRLSRYHFFFFYPLPKNPCFLKRFSKFSMGFNNFHVPTFLKSYFNILYPSPINSIQTPPTYSVIMFCENKNFYVFENFPSPREASIMRPV